MTETPVDLRCAAWTQAGGFDPAGSAVPLDRLVLVEVPLPWPKNAEEVDWLDVPDVPDGVRLQCIVPESPRDDGSVLVTRWERADAGMAGTDWLAPARHVAAVVRAVAHDQPVDPALLADRPDAGPTPAPPEVLVCAHGTRDVCCGGSGTRLAVEVRAALSARRVRRTSHLGGHRFAPTALTLPDGRAWAHLDADTVLGILDRSIDPAEARRHYRGNTALAAEAQVVEAGLLADKGWAVFDRRALRADLTADGPDRTRVTLEWEGPDGPGRIDADVVVTQRYPVLQCGLPPEEARKTAPEYALLAQP